MSEINEKIISEICYGLDSGKSITERALAEKLKISRTPIRETLKELEIRRMIDRSKGNGITIRQLSLKEVIELWDTRSVLEGMCGRIAAKRATEQNLKKLESLNKSRLKAMKAGKWQESVKIDWNFHHLIVDIADNSIVKKIMQDFHLLDSIYRKRRLALPPNYNDNYPFHHDVIIESLRARDPDKAEKVLINHIQYAKKLLIEASFATEICDSNYYFDKKGFKTK